MKKTVKVEIKETLVKIVDVEVEIEEVDNKELELAMIESKAIEKATENYGMALDGYVLDSSDFVDTEITMATE